MNNPPSTSELNRHRTDALTDQPPKTTKNAPLRPINTPATRSMDGLVKSPHASRHKSAGTVHQNPQHSRTLMRKAVKKPSAAKSADGTFDAIKTRSARIHPAKMFRAKEVAKSPKVEHFGLPAVSAPRTEVSKHPAAVRPTEVIASPGAHAPAAAVAGTSGRASSLPNSLSHQQLERLLDQALFRADAHKKMLEEHYDRRRLVRRLVRAPKWLSVGLAAILLVVAGGAYLVWRVPQVSIKVAAARAHINAAVPAYTPSGYSFAGPIDFANGAVTLKYVSGSEQSFQLIQKASNWDSQSMAASVVPKDAQVQTSQVRGTTVYIYGPSNDAAWVNHGILYKLKDNASLNSEQILKIADSL